MINLAPDTPINIGRVLYAVVISPALFFPIPYFLPIFPYAFVIALGLISVHFWLFKMKSVMGIAIWLVALGLLIASSDYNYSLLYFGTSVSMLLFMTLLLEHRANYIYTAAKIYLIVLVAVGLIDLAFGIGGRSIGTTIEDVYGNVRFRGLNDEPNYLGFSLVVIYTLLLYRSNYFFFKHGWQTRLVILLIWILALAGKSVYAVGMLCFVTLLFAMINGKVARAMLLVGVMLAMLSSAGRVDSILAGEDNSANFRTWGSYEIAYDLLQFCGGLGCGLGSSRNVLTNDFSLEAFSGVDLLPNMLASALLEGGYLLFASIILTAIICSNLFNAIFNGLNKDSVGFSCSILVVLLGYAGTSSFLYDPQFWSIAGLAYVVTRQHMTVGSSALQNSSDTPGSHSKQTSAPSSDEVVGKDSCAEQGFRTRPT